MTLVRRRLRATITLSQLEGQSPQTFSGTSSNQVIVQDLRMSAEVLHAGGPSDGTLDLTIYGLLRSTMNRLSTLGMQIDKVPRNAIVLEASNDDGQFGTVFTGYILAAYADFNAQPDVSFHITSHTLTPQSVATAPATSYNGSTDILTIMSSLARQLGLKFENNGVTGQLLNPYFAGSLKSQAQQCADAGGFAWNHGDLGTLAIWPKNKSRDTAQIPLISPSTGMKGYPTYTAYGINVETIYNPSIGFGGKVQVQSSLQPACGTWAVYGLNHHLECEVPDGNWFSTVLCYNPKFSPPVNT